MSERRRVRWGLGGGLVVAALALGVVGPAAAPAGARTAAPAQPGPLGPIVEATVLPPPPGAPAGAVPVPYDLDDAGRAVGQVGGRPVLWRDGGATFLPAGGPGEPTVATHIDGQGRVIVADGDRAAYRWAGGQVTPITVGTEPVRPLFVNAAGQVVLAVGPAGTGRAVLWDEGRVSEIRSPDGGPVVPTGLSDAGHVSFDTVATGAGGEARVPWVWRDGTATRLAATGRTRAVNRSGHVVGEDPAGAGLLWRDGATVPLGLRPTDINDRGQVVGTRSVAGVTHAFRWDDGVLTRLGQVGEPPAGAGLPTGPVAVNEAGQAAGMWVLNGRLQYALWAGDRMISLGLAPPGAEARPPALNERGSVAIRILAEQDRPERAVRWDITYPGDPPAPDTECVTANNWAHVRDGRAVAYAHWAWAAGSGEFLGATTETTTLRRSAPGTWTRVERC